MNTNTLKKFAQEARRKLIEQVEARLAMVLTTDSAELREKAEHVRKLQKAINASSKKQVVDKVAYTWFNRLMALRFMDANDYQPLGLRVLTPKEGFTTPELLDEAKQGHIHEELPVKQQHVFDLLDGKIPANNAQNEAYKELLIAACNHLNKVFPFLFERINDYTELLLPDDLSSEFSIVHDFRMGMSDEDCKEVEIIGWLYQFYISERKDEVFASKSKVQKEDIPAATQLFTPRWIVEYMVQNTLGKLWLQNNPNSGLRAHMPYFIESPSVEAKDYLKVNSVEEITLLDQACGSGHILVYAFELFAKIYEEQGYNPTEIPQLIIEKNLFGFEIDERAAQLAGMALMMKARSYQRRLFNKHIEPNVLCYKDLQLKMHNIDLVDFFKIKINDPQLSEILNYGYRIAQNIEKKWNEDFEDEDTGETVTIERVKVYLKSGTYVEPDNLDIIKEHGGDEIAFFKDEVRDTFRSISIPLSNKLYKDFVFMKQATNLGSLIIPNTAQKELIETLNLIKEKQKTGDVFLEQMLEQIELALSQLIPLSKKYHCIVDNPPYMGGGNMNKHLADFVKAKYPVSKSDLMTCFMESGLHMLKPKGFLGMINQHSWMFLSSYENLRENLIRETFFDTLLHLGSRTFPEIGGEVVQNASFTFWNNIAKEKGSYIRLIDFGDSNLKREKTLEAIQNPNCGWFYTANQINFEKIPGSPIGYWVSMNEIKAFENVFLKDVLDIKSGLLSGKDEIFIKKWFEVSNYEINFNLNNSNDLIEINPKWTPISSGGDFRKWYGNINNIVNSKNNFYNIKNLKGNNFRLRDSQYYFRKSVNWPMISPSNYGAKFVPNNVILGNGVRTGFVKLNINITLEYFIGYLSSNVVKNFLSIINPTLNYNNENIAILPFIYADNEIIDDVGGANVDISKQEWNSHDTSWDFLQNELIRIKAEEELDLEETYDLYQQFWRNKFIQLHKNEEELNKQFIEIYGLEDELTPDVPFKDITILQQELNREALKQLKPERNAETGLVASYANISLQYNAKEIFAQFISYAVGCMFGRYSLDKQGLILANQGETLEDYFAIIEHRRSEVTERSRNEVTERSRSARFIPDDDNIIPILDDEWFEDDIVGGFYAFLKTTFGKQNFEKNLAFVEECLGKDIRKYFIKDFYTDHIKRYKKRPIYWMFSSPKGTFNVLIYMHRYTPDTLNLLLNGYLKEYRLKLSTRIESLDHLIESGSSSEQTKAAKEKDKIRATILELQEYEREILYPLATERIAIDLDDGVLVNYNKFGQAIKSVSGLNDKKAKEKVRNFDWINTEEIR